ncbi:ubiquitin carboxyl-terminal hydrolase 42-like isoform X2 [Cyanistes caeruleus]|uniref:ubiquitin carboxyl-terminal hydrolase 42-like isoform X2 n=1 Tax=Cyanistes caeruleus TaxID=156563 RepID=UPI000CDAA553|nr:ubiquitin carboxyl-terminal hydrolase 42-like isoform X2 [Cyanistes caeruleus]
MGDCSSAAGTSSTSTLFKWNFSAVIAEGIAPPKRILFPLEKIYMVWQQQQSAGAGLFNVGNTCFLNAVLQCLTYTPPLANYLLSREHSKACQQQGFCMMCTMEAHVNKVLHSPVSAIVPWAVLKVFGRIGEHFQLGMQEDAHDFLCCTVNAMQRACLSASSDLDLSSESTTIVHQIFGGFLRSRVTCCSCKAVSDSYEAFLDVPLDINAASSLTAALEAFVTPEQLDGENCFKCNKCTENVAASKRFTIHCAPKVLTVCLKRFDCFTGGKINKASNGLWYQMDDESVEVRSIDTALGQQAYLLFYARCSDLRLGEEASSSLAPSYAPSVLSQWAACSKQVASVVPQVLPDRTKDMVLSVEDPGQEEAQSASPLWSRDGYSCFLGNADCDDATGRNTGPPSCGHDAKDDAASGPSNRSLESACGPGDAWEETLLRQKETSRSAWSGYDLHSRKQILPVVTTPPVDSAVRGPSCSSLKQAPMLKAGQEEIQPRWREQRRSPEHGCDLQGRSGQCTDHPRSLS